MQYSVIKVTDDDSGQGKEVIENISVRSPLDVDVEITQKFSQVRIINNRRWFKIITVSLLIGIVFLVSAFFALPWLERWNPRRSTDSYLADRITFGSCSSFDLRDISIWRDAIIPTEPSVWIWTGDMAYIDAAEFDCNYAQLSILWQTNCNCTPTWLAAPPYSCRSGDIEYAHNRWMKTLQNRGYNEFLEYMCPDAYHRGIFPPLGTDSSQCERAILGVYDDHDYGSDNGNKRLPNKWLYKEMFLDAIGEPRTSQRRGTVRGAWDKKTLNAGVAGAEVDIYLLDERYERDTLPCESRRELCTALLSDDSIVVGIDEATRRGQKAWCEDFLVNGAKQNEGNNNFGLERMGSCCLKDEQIFFGWCLLNTSLSNVYFREACDVTYEHFGMRALTLDHNGDLTEPVDITEGDKFQESPFCDVLGRQQREWLRNELRSSSAALSVFVSGSVVLGNPTHNYCSGMFVTGKNRSNQESIGTEISCRCTGDDFDCYRVAQKELLYLISSSQPQSGCSVIITGDLHFGDIKALYPDAHPYTQSSAYPYPSSGVTTDISETWNPVYQVMSSGLTDSTALNYSCTGERRDPLGLRTHRECDFVTGPNFGMLELSYQTSPDGMVNGINEIFLRVMGGTKPGAPRLETVVDGNTCSRLGL